MHSFGIRNFRPSENRIRIPSCRNGPNRQSAKPVISVRCRRFVIKARRYWIISDERVSFHRSGSAQHRSRASAKKRLTLGPQVSYLARRQKQYKARALPIIAVMQIGLRGRLPTMHLFSVIFIVHPPPFLFICLFRQGRTK